MSNSSDKDKADWGNDTAPDAPYAVGNKKPPRHTQFKPGFSGNPDGRPKGSVNLRTRVRQGLRKSIMVNKNGRPTRMPVLEVIANRLLESSMKGDLKAIQWVDQSDQEATANEMAKHGEAEDIGLPNKEALRKTSSQRTSSATVIPFRASANELSMTARNYGKDIPELWEGHPRIMGRTRRNYDHDTPKLTARRAPYCAPIRP